MGRRSRVLPWEICSSAERLAGSRGVARGGQKSAEAIVAAAQAVKGRTRGAELVTKRSMDEGDAGKRAEKPERSRESRRRNRRGYREASVKRPRHACRDERRGSGTHGGGAVP